MPLTVTSPVNGDSLSAACFYASGTSDTNVPIYAVLNPNTENPTIGQLISLPPYFVFQFENVPAGSNYTLLVQDYENPPNSDDVTDLTVVSG